MVWQQVRDATQKGSLSESPENCPNCIKLYNSKMGRVDLMDHLKSAYQLDRRLKSQFYLCLFFDLLDVAFVNSFIVYKKLENKDRTLKEFKICIALKLIFSFVSRKLSFMSHRPFKRIWCSPLPSRRKKLFFTISLISQQ